jgi:hypothetical protein
MNAIPRTSLSFPRHGIKSTERDVALLSFGFHGGAATPPCHIGRAALLRSLSKGFELPPG